MKPITPQNKMNRTEAAYADRLENMKHVGIIMDYVFEPFKFVLANRTTYTPDFLVVFKDRFEIHEVKGFWRDDARVKIKVTAEKFKWFKFIAIQYKRKQWIIEEF